MSKPALSVNHTSRKVVACAAGQSAASTLSGAACLRPPVLDESLIREQTKVDHFWGESSAPYRVGEAPGGSRLPLDSSSEGGQRLVNTCFCWLCSHTTTRDVGPGEGVRSRSDISLSRRVTSVGGVSMVVRKIHRPNFRFQRALSNKADTVFLSH